MPIPDPLAEPLRFFNLARRKVGKRPLIWDDRLGRAAQELCDWGWKFYLSGGNFTADPHHDFQGRIERSRFPLSMTPPHDSRPGAGTVAECGAVGTGGPSGKYPADAKGYSYPEKTPEALALQLVELLTGGKLPSDEAHVWDFKTSWTHVGIGYKGGLMVLDYGYIAGTPEPSPNPGPEPAPTPSPTPGPIPVPGPVVIDDGKGWVFHMG